MPKPLQHLTERLAKGCPLCGTVPRKIRIDGPDAIVLKGCSHVIDAKEWLDRVDADEVQVSEFVKD